jgi:hypothetical protein
MFSVLSFLRRGTGNARSRSANRGLFNGEEARSYPVNADEPVNRNRRELDMPNRWPQPASEYSSCEYEIAPPDEDSRKDAARVVSMLQEAHMSLLLSRRRVAKEARETLERAKAEYMRVLGGDTVQRLRARAQELRRERNTVRWSSPRGIEPDSAMRKRLRGELDSIAESARVDKDTLRRLRAGRRTEVARILGIDQDPPDTIARVPLERVPQEIVKRSSNPYTIRTPPFDSWYMLSHYYMDDGSLDFKPTSDPVSGLVGHRSDYVNYDAGEQLSINFEIDDWFDLWTSCSVGFWYKPPTSGVIDVWFKVRYYEELYSKFWLDDAWGIHENDADIWSKAYVAVDTMQDVNEESRVQVLWHHLVKSPDDPVTDKVGFFGPNQTWWWNVKTKPVSANKWVFLRIGTHDKRTALLDDVDTKQWMRHRFYIEEVQYKVL